MISSFLRKSFLLFLVLSLLVSTACATDPIKQTETRPAETRPAETHPAETLVPSKTEEAKLFPWPTPHKTYAEDFFVRTVNRGDSKRLLGKVLICFFVLSDDEKIWTDEDLKVLKGYHNLSLRHMKAEASRYGVTLDVQLHYIPCTYDGLLLRSESQAQVREVLASLGYSDPNRVAPQLMREFDVSSAALLFCIPSDERSFSYPSASPSGFEYAVLYGKSEDFRHELYHLYGARDFYLPDKVEAAAQRYFPNSIMLFTNGSMDDLTAYLVGWSRGITEKALLFLEEIKTFTASDFNS